MGKIIFVVGLLLSMSPVNAEDQQKSIRTDRELGIFFETYYLNPNSKRLRDALNFVDSSGMAKDQKLSNVLKISFSCLFSNYKAHQIDYWHETIERLEQPSKSLLKQAIESTPDEIISVAPLSPAKNDMNWACFFATGDAKYLNNILLSLEYLDERLDLQKYLSAASAKWSLASNSKTHTKVRMALEKMREQGSKTMQSVAEDILNKEPGRLREEMIAVLKAQKHKGVWSEYRPR